MHRQRIAKLAERMGFPRVNPAHIEAFMRVQHPDLAALSRSEFRAEVATCIECVRMARPGLADRLMRRIALIDAHARLWPPSEDEGAP